MKNLVLSSILIALLSGCSYHQFSGFQRTSEPVIGLTDIRPWFTFDPGYYLFNADIDIYKNHFGGMMVIKYQENGNCRVVYLTEVGIKVFDMEFFRNGDFKLHYCLEALNRKIIIRTLRNDLDLMLADISSDNELKLLVDQKQYKSLFISRDHSIKKYYSLDNNSGRTEEILTRNWLRKKVEIKYFSNNHTDIDSVRLKHNDIRLQIHLSRINETKTDVPE